MNIAKAIGPSRKVYEQVHRSRFKSRSQRLMKDNLLRRNAALSQTSRSRLDVAAAELAGTIQKDLGSAPALVRSQPATSPVGHVEWGMTKRCGTATRILWPARARATAPGAGVLHLQLHRSGLEHSRAPRKNPGDEFPPPALDVSWHETGRAGCPQPAAAWRERFLAGHHGAHGVTRPTSVSRTRRQSHQASRKVKVTSLHPKLDPRNTHPKPDFR